MYIIEARVNEKQKPLYFEKAYVLTEVFGQAMRFDNFDSVSRILPSIKSAWSNNVIFNIKKI